MDSHTRRAFLGAVGAGAATLAGCSGDRTGSGGSTPATDTGTTATEGTTASPSGPPTAERTLHVAHSYPTLREAIKSGGPGKDGIPSVDEPTFQSASETKLADEEIVFGLVRNGVAKAYPQYVLVWHEICNDTVGGEPVAISYCPLTGTVMGFERGETTFGVSGDLVNSNLVMYDRASDSRWPQVLATAIQGEHQGASLREFRLVWTTWGTWRRAHPDTMVLTEETGYARQYGNDPYGDYAPKKGYYASEQTMFPSLSKSDRFGAKTVVIGARTTDGALAVHKPTLREDRLVSLAIGDTDYLVVHDSALDTGYVYANTEGVSFEVAGENSVRGPEGETHDPRSLPLPSLPAMDAMWFAWAGFYPETTVHG